MRDEREYREVRIEALKRGRLQWGHDGRHHGRYGDPDCPRELHHHHDDYCELPTLGEVAAAGVEVPEGGWHSRA